MQTDKDWTVVRTIHRPTSRLLLKHLSRLRQLLTSSAPHLHTGVIPTELGDLQAITNLDLSRTRLIGETSLSTRFRNIDITHSTGVCCHMIVREPHHECTPHAVGVEQLAGCRVAEACWIGGDHLTCDESACPHMNPLKPPNELFVDMKCPWMLLMSGGARLDTDCCTGVLRCGAWIPIGVALLLKALDWFVSRDEQVLQIKC